jgi:hypothetical protein
MKDLHSFGPAGLAKVSRLASARAMNVQEGYMPTTPFEGSKAFDKLLNLSKEQNKKYAENRRFNTTEEHRLLSESTALSLRQSRVNIFTKKVLKAIDLCDRLDKALTRSDWRVLAAVTGWKDAQQSAPSLSTLASNPHGRAIYFDETFSRLQAIHADDEVDMYFITIVDTAWCQTGEATTFDTASMALRAKRALRDIGYHGMLILEIQGVLALREGRFMPHLHGFVWRRRGEGMEPKAALQRLRQRFTGIRQAKGVVMRRVESHLPKSLATRFFYNTKLPDTIKRFCPVKNLDTAFVSDPPGKLRTAAASDYSNLDALRISLILGQHTIDSTVFAAGEGTKVRKVASKVLTAKLDGLRLVAPTPSAKAVLSVIAKVLNG